MLFAIRIPRLNLSVLASLLITLIHGTTNVYASSPDAWDEFRQNVEKACIKASTNLFEVQSIQVDPFGSESYGFAVLYGVEVGTTTERLFVCTYNKTSEIAEISSAFDQ